MEFEKVIFHIHEKFLSITGLKKCLKFIIFIYLCLGNLYLYYKRYIIFIIVNIF